MSNTIDLDNIEIIENAELDGEIDKCFKYEPKYMPDREENGDYNFNFIKNCTITLGTDEESILGEPKYLRPHLECSNADEVIIFNIHKIIPIKLEYNKSLNIKQHRYSGECGSGINLYTNEKYITANIEFTGNKLTYKSVILLMYIKIVIDNNIKINKKIIIIDYSILLQGKKSNSGPNCVGKGLAGLWIPYKYSKFIDDKKYVLHRKDKINNTLYGVLINHNIIDRYKDIFVNCHFYNNNFQKLDVDIESSNISIDTFYKFKIISNNINLLKYDNYFNEITVDNVIMTLNILLSYVFIDLSIYNINYTFDGIKIIIYKDTESLNDVENPSNTKKKGRRSFGGIEMIAKMFGIGGEATENNKIEIDYLNQSTHNNFDIRKLVNKKILNLSNLAISLEKGNKFLLEWLMLNNMTINISINSHIMIKNTTDNKIININDIASPEIKSYFANYIDNIITNSQITYNYIKESNIVEITDENNYKVNIELNTLLQNVIVDISNFGFDYDFNGVNLYYNNTQVKYPNKHCNSFDINKLITKKQKIKTRSSELFKLLSNCYNLLPEWFLPITEFPYEIKLEGNSIVFENQKLAITDIAAPKIREYFQNIADSQDTDTASQELLAKYCNYPITTNRQSNSSNSANNTSTNQIMTQTQFNYLTPKYKQLYLNRLITNPSEKFVSFVAKCLAEPANFGHIYETLKLCIELRDSEYISAICNELWQSQQKNQDEYANLAVNWSLLQYEAKLSGDMEIFRRMKYEEFIRA